jgi:hypothetical protein
MNRRPSTASASLVGRVTLTLHGPIGELAAALRTLADALDQEQATSTVTYTATVAPQARGPAPGGMTASLADRFVARLIPAAVEVLAVVCRHAPEVTYEELQAHVQAQLGIGRDRLGGVLTSLAGARKRLPRDVDYPIERDKDLRHYRIEPVAAELLLGAVERARAAGLVAGRARPMLRLSARQARLDRLP